MERHILRCIYGEAYMERHIWRGIYGDAYMERHKWRGIYGEAYMERYICYVREDLSLMLTLSPPN
jgi:hypothetical protein